MKAEFINPFILASKSVFETMLKCPLTRGKPYMKKGRQPEHEISGVIEYSGRATGCVVISLSRDVAINATRTMLMDESISEFNSHVVDAVGELANMVAGAAKRNLAELELSISLPSIIIGKSHAVDFPSNMTPMCIPFTCEWGEVLIEYALREQDPALESASAS